MAGAAAFDEAFDFFAFDLDRTSADVSLANAPVTVCGVTDARVTTCVVSDAVVTVCTVSDALADL